MALMISKGSIFFKQERVGKGGRHFKIIKFRTMIPNAHLKGNISIGRDPRVTRLGYILRVTKLDELPQLINVLKGDMSIIGPRPEIPEIVQKYYTEEQKEVLSVRPGLIGPAQIIGRNESEMLPEDIDDAQEYYIKYILPDKLKIDLEYVKNVRFLNDIKLFLKGIFVTITGIFKPFSENNYLTNPNLFLIDVFLVFCSYTLAYGLRFDWSIPKSEIHTLLYSLPIVVTIRILFFSSFRLYQTVCRYVGISDLIQILKATLMSSGCIVVVLFFIGMRFHSRSIFIIDWLLLFLSMSGIRVLFRLLSEKKVTKSYKPADHILIVGAGDVGEMLARDISKNGSQFRVVGFIDDDPQKIGSTIHGIKVYGNRQDIPNIAKLLRVDEIIIAIRKIKSEEMRSILHYCEKSKVKHKIVPAVEDLISGRIHLSKIREIDVSDLLGREPLLLNLGAIKNFIKGKKILVTGAGGSIGSELSMQLLEHEPAQLIMLDRNENYLFELQTDISISPQKMNTQLNFIIADITNSKKMENILSFHKPQIIFHAAAQKHVPLSESNPDEAIKNNIYGTQILALLGHKYNVNYFVLISSDKAVNPTNIMGATKRVAEKWIKLLSENSKTTFITVRFGNVINSHGSVIPLFLKQIHNGGPVTVTDPNVTRFFMSISEAVNLILQAVIIGKSGEIYILDMGRSIKIDNLAHEMIKQAGMKPGIDINIKYIGLRPGEKLYEELIGQNEIAFPTNHSMIRRIVQKPLNSMDELEEKINALFKVSLNGNKKEIVKKLKRIVPEYQDNLFVEYKKSKQPKKDSASLDEVQLYQPYDYTESDWSLAINPV